MSTSRIPEVVVPMANSIRANVMSPAAMCRPSNPRLAENRRPHSPHLNLCTLPLRLHLRVPFLEYLSDLHLGQAYPIRPITIDLPGFPPFSSLLACSALSTVISTAIMCLQRLPFLDSWNLHSHLKPFSMRSTRYHFLATDCDATSQRLAPRLLICLAVSAIRTPARSILRVRGVFCSRFSAFSLAISAIH